MAAIVVTQTINRWHGQNTDAAAYDRAKARDGDTSRKMLETMVLGLPHFEVYGTTDTDTADSDAINLSDLGVTFAAATQRTITVEAFVSQAAETGYIKHVATVNGADGTTPEVDGQVALVNLTDAVDATQDPFILVEVTSNEVIVNVEGDTDVDTRWVLHIYVSDAVPLAFIPTT